MTNTMATDRALTPTVLCTTAESTIDVDALCAFNNSEILGEISGEEFDDLVHQCQDIDWKHLLDAAVDGNSLLRP